MCLAELGVVTRVDGNGTALVDRDGRTASVSLLTLDEAIQVGDWLVVHAGFAVARVTPEDAAAALVIRDTTGKEVP